MIFAEYTPWATDGAIFWLVFLAVSTFCSIYLTILHFSYLRRIAKAVESMDSIERKKEKNERLKNRYGD
jgi:hypothetical protein